MKRQLISLFLIFLTTGIYAHVEITYPTVPTTYSPGEQIEIQWRAVIPHNTLNYDLYFSANDGTTWEIIKFDIAAETLKYTWTVPDVPTMGAKIKIIQDNSDFDYEAISTKFTIAGSTLFSRQVEYLVTPPYPNPFNYSATFTFRYPVSDPYTMKVYNSVGQLLRTFTNINTDQFTLYRDDLAAGSYFYQVYSDKNQNVAGGKLVIW